jgi:DNA-binding CsgD family transcriptional regulator
MGRRRISLEGRLHDYDPEVGRLWRSRNDEPEQEVFDRLPWWMLTPYEDKDTRIDLKRLFPTALETLTHREQKLLWCRFWADYTLDETGMVFGVTRERIRQIEAKAIRKLKHPTRSDVLRTLMEFCPRKKRLEEQEQEALNKWREAYREKEMLERHTQYMENQLIKKLLELRLGIEESGE